MPATYRTAAAPTSRQISYIQAMRAERGLEPLANIALPLTRNGASQMIETLLNMPRTPRPTRSAPTDSQDGEAIPTPSVATRAGRMLLAGGIEATVTLPNGQHVTFRITSRHRVGRGWANCAPTDEGAYTNIKVLGQRIGWINVTETGWKLTFRTGQVHIKDAARALFGYASRGRGDTDWGAYRVQEASRCGRCLRALTDPVSIEHGIGPECFGRTTGSHHAAVDREVSRSEIQERNERIDTALATPAAQPPLTSELQRARDLIAEALDAYSSTRDAEFALNVFDQLAR